MIAMGMISTYDEYRQDQRASAPVYSASTHAVRRAMLRALAMIGVGLGGITAIDDDDAPGIG